MAGGDASSDADLVLATAQGDGDAFAVLIRRHVRAATLLAAQLLGDQDDAEDVVQVAFTLVYERARKFDATRPFSPWLHGMVRRLAANRRARDARRARLLRLWGRFSGRSVETIDEGLDQETLGRAVGELSPMQRACFELVALRGISIEEAAAMHGISASTVRQHVFRARRAMKGALRTDPEREHD